MAKINWDMKREQWVKDVTSLMNDIKRWCDKKQWQVVKHDKQMSEAYLGSYTVPMLMIVTPNGKFNVDPIGRNIVGAEGRVDINAIPSLNRMLLIHNEKKWQLKTESLIDWPNDWDESTFYDISIRLH